MNASEYLKFAKDVTIEVIGLGKEKAQKLVRPSEEILERIMLGAFTNYKITFQDEANFKIDKEITVTEIRLYYGKELVAMRKMPELFMAREDTLTVRWDLTITRTGKIIMAVLS